jgi:hypothetical protein
MDPLPVLQRILKKPSAEDLVSLQGMLLAWEAEALEPERRERIATTLALLGDFHHFLTGLESKLEAHAYAEIASRMDMAAVGGVVAENVLASGGRLLERMLIGGLSELLMMLASRQYIKAFDRELGAFYRQVAWQLRAHLWRFSARNRPGLTPAQRTSLIDALFISLLDGKTPGEAKSIVLGFLFQVSLLGTIAPILPLPSVS